MHVEFLSHGAKYIMFYNVFCHLNLMNNKAVLRRRNLKLIIMETDL